MSARFAIRFTRDGAFEFYTDASDLSVLSIDDNASSDRVCEWPLITRLSPEKFDELIGNDTVISASPQAAAAQLARAIASMTGGKPKLKLVMAD